MNKKPVKKLTGKEIVPVEVVEGELMREAPKQRNIDVKQFLQPVFNPAQLRILTNKTPEWAVKVRQGRGGKMFKYVPHGYVTDALNQAFGFDWDLIIEPMANGMMYALQFEPKYDSKTGAEVGQPDRHIAVCGKLVVRVKNKKGELTATLTKSGFGSQMWLPTMELGDALKAARSDLIKTCAFQLGIALDLYWNERAEVDTYIAKRAAKEENQRMADQLVGGVPENAVQLLSRAHSEFNIDGMKVAEICHTSIDLLMVAKQGEIEELWKLVQDAAKEGK